MRLSSFVLLATVLTFGLTGCGGDDAPAETAEAPPVDGTAPPVATPAPTSAPAPQTQTGELAAGDRTLDTGELADSYPLTVQAGQTVVVDVRTDGELDPYVILRAPSGAQEENDDYESSVTHSRVEHVATESGSYDAIVTSYEPGETGSYTATLTVRD